MKKQQLDKDELIDQIWQAPEDVDRLSVYADWLLQHGDVTRGEYMQLALLPKATPAQQKRQETLRKKHRGAWLGAARPFVYTWEESDDSPGFVSRVKVNLDKFAKGFAKVAALGPRLLVDINPVITAAGRKQLAKLPLGELYGLGLYETDLQWVDDRLLAAMLPKLEGLRKIELLVDTETFSIATWRSVLKLSSLFELSFHCMGSPDEYLVELTTSKTLPPQLSIVEVSQPRSAALAKALKREFKGRYLKLEDW